MTKIPESAMRIIIESEIGLAIKKERIAISTVIRKELQDLLKSPKTIEMIRKSIIKDLEYELSDNGITSFLTNKEYDALCKKAVKSVIK